MQHVMAFLTVNHSSMQTPNSHPPNPFFGGTNVKELGANLTVKMVSIGFISITVTVEKIAWTKFLWAKFGPRGRGEGGGE
jgi:hypothetical protein